MLTASAQTDNTGNEALLTAGRLMATQGNYTGALDQLRLVDRSALLSDIRMEVALDEARWLWGAGLYARAYDAFTAFGSQYPFSTYRTVARKGAADCLFALGDFVGAYNLYSSIDSKGLNSADAAERAYRMGVSALETGKNGAAALFMQSASYAPLRSASYFYLGKIAYDKGDYAEALRNFKSVNTHEAPGNRAGLYLAAIDFAQGNYAQALATARRELRAPGLDNETVGELNRIAGESLYRQDDNSEACEYLQKYVKLVAEPLPSALYILGIDSFNKGDYEKALGYMALSPNEPTACSVSRHISMPDSVCLRKATPMPLCLHSTRPCRMTLTPKCAKPHITTMPLLVWPAPLCRSRLRQRLSKNFLSFIPPAPIPTALRPIWLRDIWPTTTMSAHWSASMPSRHRRLVFSVPSSVYYTP